MKRLVIVLSTGCTIPLLLLMPLLILISMAAHGDVIAFVSGQTGEQDIFVIDVGRGDTYNLTHYTYNDNFPSWSPDGNKLAFVSWRGSSRIMMMDASGANPRVVADNIIAITASPAWSPEGEQLALQSAFPDNNTIYLIRSTIRVSDGTTITDAPPAWADFVVRSADGTQTLFTTIEDGNSEIFLTDTNGDTHNLTRDSGWDTQPVWSPDGTKIAFTSRRAGNTDIYVMSVDGTGMRRLTYTTGADGFAVWRP